MFFWEEVVGRIRLWAGLAREPLNSSWMHFLELSLHLTVPITCKEPECLSVPRKMQSILRKSKVRNSSSLRFVYSPNIPTLFCYGTGWDYYVCVLFFYFFSSCQLIRTSFTANFLRLREYHQRITPRTTCIVRTNSVSCEPNRFWNVIHLNHSFQIRSVNPVMIIQLLSYRL